MPIRVATEVQTLSTCTYIARNSLSAYKAFVTTIENKMGCAIDFSRCSLKVGAVQLISKSMLYETKNTSTVYKLLQVTETIRPTQEDKSKI